MQQIKLADYQKSLRELGCSAEVTDTVMQLLRSGDTKNAALLLRRHKHLLLAELHRTEQKVDLLDFLLYPPDRTKSRPAGFFALPAKEHSPC